MFKRNPQCLLLSAVFFLVSCSDQTEAQSNQQPEIAPDAQENAPPASETETQQAVPATAAVQRPRPQRRSGPCDRRCLLDITEQFLEAKTYNNLDGLVLSSDLRATSNSEETELGKGETWEDGITINNRYTFVDAKTGSAIFFGTMAGKPVENPDWRRDWWHYALRLKINAAGEIVEVEEQAIQKGMQWADKVEVPFKEADIFFDLLPEDERVAEAELIAAADAYWDALTTGDASAVPFHPDCQRTEFGKYTTNATIKPHGRGIPNWQPEDHIGPSCRSFHDRPRFRWNVDNRRYYVVDEARGVVVGVGQLNQRCETCNPSITLFEAFKVIDGRLYFLWAPSFDWGFEESGWPDWERPN